MGDSGGSRSWCCLVQTERTEGIRDGDETSRLVNLVASRAIIELTKEELKVIRDAHDAIDCTAVQCAQTTTVAIESHRLRELALGRDRSSKELNVGRLAWVDGEKRDRVGARLYVTYAKSAGEGQAESRGIFTLTVARTLFVMDTLTEPWENKPSGPGAAPLAGIPCRPRPPAATALSSLYILCYGLSCTL